MSETYRGPAHQQAAGEHCFSSLSLGVCMCVICLKLSPMIGGDAVAAFHRKADRQRCIFACIQGCHAFINDRGGGEGDVPS